MTLRDGTGPDGRSGANPSLYQFLDWKVVLDAAADLEAETWRAWMRAGSFGWAT